MSHKIKTAIFRDVQSPTDIVSVAMYVGCVSVNSTEIYFSEHKHIKPHIDFYIYYMVDFNHHIDVNDLLIEFSNKGITLINNIGSKINRKIIYSLYCKPNKMHLFYNKPDCCYLMTH